MAMTLKPHPMVCTFLSELGLLGHLVKLATLLIEMKF